MSNKNIALVKELFKAWNSGDTSSILNCYEETFLRENMHTRKQQSRRQFEKTVKEYLQAFPDINYEAEMVIEEEPNLVVCWRVSGHHRGKIMGIPATGKFISFTGVSVLEIEQQRIKKAWYLWDEASMLRQMGMLTDIRMAG